MKRKAERPTSPLPAGGGGFLAGVLAGLTCPGSVGDEVEYPRLSGDDLGRLRGDVTRVGRCFDAVIAAGARYEDVVAAPTSW